MPIKVVDLQKLEEDAQNMYEAVVIVSKRSKQINDEYKMELNQRLEPILAKETEDDSIMNQDKLNISLEFEKRDNPTNAAVNELLDKKLHFRYRDEG